jgi:multicomponent Na+:H+ antiporter subunit F
MNRSLDWLVAWSSSVALAGLTVALVIVFVRLLLGPSLADRIVALDTIASLSIGFCAVWAVHTDHDVFLDAAATLALIGFLATIAFSRSLRRQARRQEGQP